MNTFIETIKGQDVPAYMKDSVRDLIHVKTDLFHRIYSKSFIYFPQDIKTRVIQELQKYAELMTDEEEHYLEKWDFTNK